VGERDGCTFGLVTHMVLDMEMGMHLVVVVSLHVVWVWLLPAMRCVCIT
jgi:hypothetical protein